jgi:hypothetical protein
LSYRSFSAGSFADTVVVTHTILYKNIPPTGELIGVEHAFEITAIYTTTGQIAQPTKPYTVTIHYNDLERGAAIEDTLALYWWNGSQWVKENSSVVNIVNKTITATPTHFSLWAVLGETKRLYLPLITR